MENIKRKICSKCKECLLRSDFSKLNNKPRSECKKCINLRAKKHRERNPDRVKASAKLYRDNNKLKSNERNRIWRAKNPDKTKALKERHYQKHKKSILKKNKEYYDNNREAYNKYRKEWRKQNPDKVLDQLRRARRAHPGRATIWSRKRNKRKKAAGGFCIENEWNLLCELCKNRCLVCDSRENLTVDHVIPVSKNGTSDINNLQPLCRSCNSRKNDSIIDYRIKIRDKQKFIKLITRS